MGVSIFSTQVYPQFDLNTYSTKDDVIRAVRGIFYKVKLESNSSQLLQSVE